MLTAKLYAYDCDTSLLKLIHNCLANRYQRVKINNSYSLFNLIQFCVSQGSILGPILSKIFLYDLFLIVKDFKFHSSFNIIQKMTTENFSIQNSYSQQLLRVTIDKSLNFIEHISNLCKDSNMKIAALARTFPCITLKTLKQRTILMKPYFMSQYGYCFVSHRTTGLIYILHERALRFVYNGLTSSFARLLERDNLITIQQRYFSH